MPLKKIRRLIASDTSKDSLMSVSGQGIAAIAGFVFTAIATNVVSLQEFGYFSLALATATIVKDMVDPALNAALVKFVPLSRGSAEQITRYVIKIKVAYFGIVLGFGFLFAGVLSEVIFKVEWQFLLIMTLATAATLSTGSLISGFLQAHKEFFLDSVFVALQPLLRLVLLGVAIWFGYMGVIELLVVNAVAYLIVIGLFASRITYEFVSGEVTSTSKNSANTFIRPLTLSTITGTLIDRVGLYITNYLLGPAAVGVLAVIMRLFIPAQQIAGVLQSVFGTRFASFTNDLQAKIYLKKGLLVILPIALVAIGTIPFAGIILRVFGEQYGVGAWALRLITLGFVAFLFQVPFIGKILYYKSRADILVKISFIQLILVVIFEWVLIQVFGLNGAAGAITITMITISGLYMFAAQKATKREA